MICAHLAGIQVFATGGIGGVHRGAETSFDISADLRELAETPVTVVAAGAKAILDLPKTLEYLETLGVPVIAFGQDDFPAFWSRSSGLKAPLRMDSAADIAAAHRCAPASACPAASSSPTRSRPRPKSPRRDHAAHRGRAGRGRGARASPPRR
jgi:pseudouridylate synthase